MSSVTKMSVDSSGFKQGVDQAKASLKTLDAALKVNEASFKAGGNAEIYMQQKTQLLNDKMTKQRELVNTLQARMARMRDAGVNPLSTEYQKLETQLLDAQTSMIETKTTIDELDASQQNATDSAAQLSDGVSKIGRKMSLDQVISGINRITTAMQNAAKQAAEFGKEIWGQITDTAARADDLATMAVTYGVDPELLQRQLKIFNTMADTSIEAFYGAKDKINKAVRDPSKEQLNYLEALGLVTPTYDSVNLMTRDAESALWAVGERLRQKVNTGELSQDDADLYAKALFGRGYKELNPLFALGQEEFNRLTGEQTAATKEALENGAALNDSIELLKQNFETLKLEVLGAIAPEIQVVTDSISTLINKLTEYAQSEAGQKVLQSMADSISAMFENLANIDPEEVINKFSEVFNTIKDGFNWIVENKDSIVRALEVIAGGFALLKVSETVLTFIKLAQGLGGLFGHGSAAAAPASGSGSAGGGLLSGVGNWITNKMGNAARLIPSTMAAWNAVPVYDWFMNSTYLGQNIRNTGDIGASISATVDKVKADLTANLQSFGEDWSGLFGQIGKMFSDPSKQASNMRLFDPQQLQTEFENLFSSADPVEVPMVPDVPENAGASISKAIGTVPVDVRLNIANYPGWLSLTGGAGGGGGGRLNSVLMKHATGLPYVPYDGYLAMLHRGERVLTEGENRDYSPMLNRRVAMDENQGSGRIIDVTLMIGPERLSEILVPLIDNGLGEVLSVSRR